MTIDFYGRSQVDAVGDRMGYVEPAGETSVDSDPIAIAKGAEHRELAERFVRFVLSDDGQRLWNTRPGAPGGPRETALRLFGPDGAALGDLIAEPGLRDPDWGRSP